MRPSLVLRFLWYRKRSTIVDGYLSVSLNLQQPLDMSTSERPRPVNGGFLVFLQVYEGLMCVPVDDSSVWNSTIDSVCETPWDGTIGGTSACALFAYASSCPLAEVG